MATFDSWRASTAALVFSARPDGYVDYFNRSVSRKTIDLLTAYDWPGNIRELQNVIQRAVIFCDETLVVDESWLDHRPTRSTGALHILGRPSTSEEKKLVESALAESCGRVAGADGAAVKLGIPRSTLESKIRSLHIDKNRFRTK